MKVTDIKFTPYSNPRSPKLKGFASVEFDGQAWCNGWKLWEGKNGLWVSSPQTIDTKKSNFDVTPPKFSWRDMWFFTEFSDDLRDEVTEKVIDAAVAARENPSQGGEKPKKRKSLSSAFDDD